MNSLLYAAGYLLVFGFGLALATAAGVFQAYLWLNLRRKGCPVVGLLTAIIGAFFFGFVAFRTWGGNAWMIGIIGIPFYWWAEFVWQIAGRRFWELHKQTTTATDAGETKQNNAETTAEAEELVPVIFGIALSVYGVVLSPLFSIGQPLPQVLLTVLLVSVFATPVVIGLLSVSMASSAAVLAPMVVAGYAVGLGIEHLSRPTSRLAGMWDQLAGICAWIHSMLEVAGNRVGDALPCGRSKAGSSD